MLSQLRDPIRLKMKKRKPDGEGGWAEEPAGELSIWALIRPLSSSKTEANPKSLEAFSTQSFSFGERFEIMLQERTDLLEIAEVFWDKRVLIPLTQPHRYEKQGGYLSFQAIILIKGE